MTSQMLRKKLESMGWKVGSVRRQRNGQIKAYVVVKNKADMRVDEFCYKPNRPNEIEAFHHLSTADGWSQTSKFLYTLELNG